MGIVLQLVIQEKSIRTGQVFQKILMQQLRGIVTGSHISLRETSTGGSQTNPHLKVIQNQFLNGSDCQTTLMQPFNGRETDTSTFSRAQNTGGTTHGETGWSPAMAKKCHLSGMAFQLASMECFSGRIEGPTSSSQDSIGG